MIYQRLITLCCALTVTPAWATTLTVKPTKDNTLYFSATGSLSNGKGQHFFAGRAMSATDVRRGLVAFDVSAIPAGSTIDDVTLTLYLDRTSDTVNRTVSVFRVLNDWGQGTSNAGGSGTAGGGGSGAAATANDATWLYRFYNTTTPSSSPAWSNAGGDYFSPASASQSVGLISDAAVPYSWTGSGLVADVQSWTNGVSGNYGWVVIGDEATANASRRFESSDNINNGTGGNPDYRPTLVVNYTVPEPATIVMLALGVPALLALRRRTCSSPRLH